MGQERGDINPKISQESRCKIYPNSLESLTYSGTFTERNQWHLQVKLQTLCPTKTLGRYNNILVSPNPARPFTEKY